MNKRMYGTTDRSVVVFLYYSSLIGKPHPEPFDSLCFLPDNKKGKEENTYVKGKGKFQVKRKKPRQHFFVTVLYIDIRKRQNNVYRYICSYSFIFIWALLWFRRTQPLFILLLVEYEHHPVGLLVTTVEGWTCSETRWIHFKVITSYLCS